MAIYLVLGPGGSGKGYLAAHLAYRWNKMGEAVYANFKLRGSEFFQKHDLPWLPPGNVLVDEPQDWFHSREWKSLDEVTRRRITKTRHARWDVYLLTQHEDQLDKVLRDNAHYDVYVSPAWKSLMIFGRDENGRICFVPFQDRHPLYFTVSVWLRNAPKHSRLRNKPIKKRRVWFRWKVARTYDTHEHKDLIGDARNTGSEGWEQRRAGEAEG